MITYRTASRADATKPHLRDPDAEQVRPRLDMPGSQTVRLWIFGLKLDGDLVNHGKAPDLKPVTRQRMNEEHSLGNGPLHQVAKTVDRKRSNTVNSGGSGDREHEAALRAPRDPKGRLSRPPGRAHARQTDPLVVPAGADGPSRWNIRPHARNLCHAVSWMDRTLSPRR
jgi:hypothetical protein